MANSKTGYPMTIAATFFVYDPAEISPTKQRLFIHLCEMAADRNREVWRVDWRVDPPNDDGARRILGRAWLDQPSGWMGYADTSSNRSDAV